MIKFEDYKQYLSPVFYKQTNLVAKSASGCYLTDVNGDRYLDFVQGIAVNALGHNYPTVVKAIQEQAGNLVNASFNLVNYESTLTLAKRLSEKAPGKLSSIFFSNGGAEATDSALKLAMSYSARSAVNSRRDRDHRIQFQIPPALQSTHGKCVFCSISGKGSLPAGT